MALNMTARNYYPGSSIDLMIEIVANHGGTFQFEVCWRDSWEVKESEDCFERLKVSSNVDGENEYEYSLDANRGTGLVTMSLELPANRTCNNCVLRWHWRSANNWGTCEDGSERVGCGLQEIYRNCADISILRNGAGIGLGLSRRRRSL